MALKVGSPHPSLEGVSQWLNSSISDEEIKGHPVLIDFWAVSCPFCLINMPRLHEWRDMYAQQGLKIVTVHLPRGPEDKDEEKVRAALREYCITDPCALDHQGLLASRFETSGIWPYYFLFDAKGTLRSRAAGGQGLQLLENALRRSLAVDNLRT